MKALTRAEAMQMVTAEAAQREAAEKAAEDAAEELYWQEYDAMRPRPAQWILLITLFSFMLLLAFDAEQTTRQHEQATARTTAHHAHQTKHTHTKGHTYHV